MLHSGNEKAVSLLRLSSILGHCVHGCEALLLQDTVCGNGAILSLEWEGVPAQLHYGHQLALGIPWPDKNNQPVLVGLPPQGFSV